MIQYEVRMCVDKFAKNQTEIMLRSLFCHEYFGYVYHVDIFSSHQHSCIPKWEKKSDRKETEYATMKLSSLLWIFWEWLNIELVSKWPETIFCL